MHSLRIRVFQFATDYNARGHYFSSLANAEFERMVAMTFLLSHHHTYSNRLLRKPIPTSTAAVRIAAEYMESNWNKKIDVVELAGIANVSTRSLFRQFQKERGQSPAEFVRNIRLHKARMMLENPDINTSVDSSRFEVWLQQQRTFCARVPNDVRRTPVQGTVASAEPLAS